MRLVRQKMKRAGKPERRKGRIREIRQMEKYKTVSGSRNVARFFYKNMKYEQQKSYVMYKKEYKREKQCVKKYTK